MSEVYVSVYEGRIPLPPEMEAVLLYPDWTADQVRAWLYWWPLSELWASDDAALEDGR